MQKYVLYNIINKINNGIYVGITYNLHKRWTRHLYNAKDGKTLLYRAMRKYGIENFYIEQKEEFEDRKSACEREIYWIDRFKKEGIHLYNITDGGEGTLGIRKFGIDNPNFGKKMKPHVKEALLKIRRKLSNEQIKEIIRLYKEEKYTQTSLSKLFNISLPQIHRIIHGKSWGDKDRKFLLTKKNISTNDRLKIIEMYNTGNYIQLDLAKIFNLSIAQIGRIIKKSKLVTN